MSPILYGPRSPLRSRPFPSSPTFGDLWRQALARALRRGSRWLSRCSRRLEATALARQRAAPSFDVAIDPVIEFHAEAGAPEGALYVDGRFIGLIDTRRL